MADTGPAIALAGANGFSGPAFLAFVGHAVTLGTGGLVHIDCFVATDGHRALAELLHAPKARAMGARLTVRVRTPSELAVFLIGGCSDVGPLPERVHFRPPDS